MSTRSSKRGNSKQVSHGSSTDNQKKKSDDEQRPGPLVLVLYTADKTRGVLLRTSINPINPTDAVKGSKCQAPVPDDAKSSSTETEENTKTCEAIVVEFGCKDHIYQILLRRIYTKHFFKKCVSLLQCVVIYSILCLNLSTGNEEYLYGLNLLQDVTVATDEVDLQSE